MKYIPKFFATLLVTLLLMVNFNIDYSLNPIDVQVNMDLKFLKKKNIYYLR